MAAAYLAAQVARASPLYRMGVTCLLLAFHVEVMLRWQTGFRALSPARRQMCIDNWQHSRLAVKRDLILFIRSFVFLAVEVS